jgi:hypothetical protein
LPSLGVSARTPEVPDDHYTRVRCLVPTAPVFTNTERLALAGFLAGYSGLTRQAYELDLRQFASWCQWIPVPSHVPLAALLVTNGDADLCIRMRRRDLLT